MKLSKLDTDGRVSNDNTCVGCRGLLRNVGGKRIDGFASNISTCSVFEAKAYGILTSMKIDAKKKVVGMSWLN